MMSHKKIFRMFLYFRVKVNMEINMLLQHNTVIVKEVAILKLY